ncbi:neogenin-like [Orbicella faveolata]|uniref:neogenin-like n=1 Tax=Orbicella faveolata TaxID=48498 RepID=UPI0009E35DC5|nr:neogenin-like [Orbicella faveolata]
MHAKGKKAAHPVPRMDFKAFFPFFFLVPLAQAVGPNPPLNVSVDSKSSRVVNISWIADFDGNSVIQNYTVKISRDNEQFVDALCQGSLSDSSCVVVSTSASLGNLSPWTLYYFKVFARNKIGISDESSVVNATTDEEVPSTAPIFDVTVVNSTAVNVSWQVLTREQARGEILGYYVLYNIKCNPTLANRKVDGKETTSYVISSLKEFTSYEFAMQAFNSKGVSQKSSVLEKRTDEDIPSSAPVLISVKVLNSTSVEVEWQPVPEEFTHGIITKYVIFYTAERGTGEKEVPASLLKAVVNGLSQSTTYLFRVRAETVKGAGPKTCPDGLQLYSWEQFRLEYEVHALSVYEVVNRRSPSAGDATVDVVAPYANQSSVNGDQNRVNIVEHNWQWVMGYGSDFDGET